MRATLHRVPIWGLVLQLGLGPVVLGAEPEAAPISPARLEQAKRHFESGATLYRAGDYEAAQVEFDVAYKLAPLPDLLFNLGQTAEKRGRLGEAADYLERYLKEQPQAQDRGQIEQQIIDLRAKVADQAPKQPPPPPPVQALPPRAPEQPLVKRLPWPAIGLGGGGVVLLIIGFGLGGAALSTAGQVSSGERFDFALDSRGRGLNNGAIALDVIGAAAFAAGAAWTGYWLYQEHRQGRLRPATGAAGAALTF